MFNRFEKPIRCECEAMGVEWSFDIIGPPERTGEEWPITDNYKCKAFHNDPECNLMLDFPADNLRDCNALLDDAENGKISRKNSIVRHAMWGKLMQMINRSEEYNQACLHLDAKKEKVVL